MEISIDSEYEPDRAFKNGRKLAGSGLEIREVGLSGMSGSGLGGGVRMMSVKSGDVSIRIF